MCIQFHPKNSKSNVTIRPKKISFFAGQKINNRGKGGKYLEKENMYFAEEKNNGGGKGGTFAKGWSIRIIICKRLADPDIICKRTVDLNDHLQGAGPSEVSLANGWSTRMIICNHKYIV